MNKLVTNSYYMRKFIMACSYSHEVYVVDDQVIIKIKGQIAREFNDYYDKLIKRKTEYEKT